MSTPVAALCQVLVEDVFGELAAQVFETLAIHGRLSLHALVQHSKLTPRQARHALTILVQHNLVVWSLDNGHSIAYEAHVRNTYNLVRHGRLLRVIDDRYGQLGRSVVSVLLQSGHAHISDVVASILQEAAKKEEEEAAAAEEAEGGAEDEQRDKKNARENGARHREDEVHEKKNEIRAMALVLVEDGFLTLVHESHFRPSADNEAQSRSIQIGLHREKVKKADEWRFNRDVRRRLADWQYNNSAKDELLQKIVPLGIKARPRRRALDLENGHGNPKKRIRLEHDPPTRNSLEVLWNRQRAEELSLLDTVLIKVNFDKLAVVVRNETLAREANEQITEATSLIYEQLLDRLGQPLLFCQGSINSNFRVGNDSDEDDDNDNDDQNGNGSTLTPGTSTILTKDIVHGVDLRNVNTDFGRPPGRRPKKSSKLRAQDSGRMDMSEDENGVAGTTKGDDEDEDVHRDRKTDTKKRKKVAVKSEKINGFGSDDDETNADDDDDDNDNVGWINDRADPDVVRQHLLMLKEYVPPLARLHPSTPLRHECWSVDFKAVSRHIRLDTINSIIRSRFDRQALRIVSILREKGKLEQKDLGKLALMNHKKFLSWLTVLHTNGYLELQEVPKDSTRAPGKTLFLWFFDERRCTIKMLEDVYKALARCLQRVRLESEKYRNVIEKSQRSDVEGNENDMLTSHEKSQLEKWRGIEGKLMIQIGRMDDVVYGLRDF